MRKILLLAVVVVLLVLAMGVNALAEETPGKGDPEQVDPPVFADNCDQQADGDDVCAGATLPSPGKPIFAGRLETHNSEGYNEWAGIPIWNAGLEPGLNCFEGATEIPCPK